MVGSYKCGCKKPNRANAMLYNVSTNTFKCIYYAMFDPRFNYGNLVWCQNTSKINV